MNERPEGGGSTHLAAFPDGAPVPSPLFEPTSFCLLRRATFVSWRSCSTRFSKSSPPFAGVAKSVWLACSSPVVPDSAWITDLTASARAGSLVLRRIRNKRSTHGRSCPPERKPPRLPKRDCSYESFGVSSLDSAIQMEKASLIAISFERRRTARSFWNFQWRSAGSLTVVFTLSPELISYYYARFTPRSCSTLQRNQDATNLHRAQSPATYACSDSRTQSPGTVILVNWYLTESKAQRKAFVLKSEQNGASRLSPVGGRIHADPSRITLTGREAKVARCQDHPRKRGRGLKSKYAEFTAHFCVAVFPVIPFCSLLFTGICCKKAKG